MFRCFQAPLKIGNVLSDGVKEFSDAFESNCSYEGECQILQNLTSKIVKVWGSRDICPGLGETM